MANDFLADSEALRAKLLYNFDVDGLLGNSIPDYSVPLTKQSYLNSDATYSLGSGKALGSTGSLQFNIPENHEIGMRSVGSGAIPGYPGNEGYDSVTICFWRYMNVQWREPRTYTGNGYSIAALEPSSVSGGPFSIISPFYEPAQPGAEYEITWNAGGGTLFPSRLGNARWYHIAATHDGVTGQNRLRIWDDLAQIYLTDQVEIQTPILGSGSLFIHAQRCYGDGSPPNDYFASPVVTLLQEKYDEVVIFNRVLGVDELTLIKDGDYPNLRLEVYDSINVQAEIGDITPPGTWMKLTTTGILKGVAVSLATNLSGSSTLVATSTLTGPALHVALTNELLIEATLRGNIMGLSANLLGFGITTFLSLRGAELPLSSNLGGTNTITATLEDAIVSLSGSVTIQSSCNAVTLDIWQTGPKEIPIIGDELAISSNFTAAITKDDVEMRGVITIESNIEGALVGNKPIEGTIDSTSVFTGTLTHYVSLVGSIDITSSLNGEPGTTIGLAGAIDIQSNFTAWIGLPGELHGTIAINSSITGRRSGIRVMKRLPGTIDIQSYFTGWIGLPGEVHGTIDIQSIITGTMLRVKFLTGTIPIQSTLVGNLTMKMLLLKGTIDIESLFTTNLGYQLADFMISRFINRPVLEHASCIVSREIEPKELKGV